MFNAQKCTTFVYMFEFILLCTYFVNVFEESALFIQQDAKVTHDKALNCLIKSKYRASKGFIVLYK